MEFLVLMVVEDLVRRNEKDEIVFLIIVNINTLVQMLVNICYIVVYNLKDWVMALGH